LEKKTCTRSIKIVGEIIVGEVYQILRKEVIILDDEGSELFLPKSEQISSDFYKGDSIRAVISSVEIVNNRLYVLSRTSNKFLETFRVRNSGSI
jgi:N utilization substance protein A